jgi:citrate lyase gamma subunit
VGSRADVIEAILFLHDEGALALIVAMNIGAIALRAAFQTA